MLLILFTENIKMDSVAKILDENIEWESAMSFAEQIVTDAFLNNVNGIIKKTNGGITVCFIKTLKNNQPEQKKLSFLHQRLQLKKIFLLYQRQRLSKTRMMAP